MTTYRVFAFEDGGDYFTLTFAELCKPKVLVQRDQAVCE
jgi:hypothetical protein